jgi:predicted porin
MQKKLLTIAVASALAAPVAALADVSVYGSIDTGIRNQSKAYITAGGAGGPTGTKLSIDGQLKKTNRWGVKGSEDLGGGLMANFMLEGGYASDTGATALDFARRAVVGFSKGGNSVDLGREYTLNFKTQGIYDPLSHDYGGSAGVQGDLTAGVRTSNSVTGAFRFGTGGVAVQYGAGEVVDDGGSGTYTAVNGDMTFGPVTIGAAWGSREAVAPAVTDVTTTNIGGAYKMGAFTFRLGMGTEDVDTGNETTKLSGGVQYDFSPTLTGRVSYYNFAVDNAGGAEIATAKVAVVNVEYSLSKRTLVYAAFDRKALTGASTFIPTGGTAANSLWGIVADGATGISAGIVHNF